MMVKVSAHFDGKAIVLDEPSRLALPSGTRVKVSIEAADETPPVSSEPRTFEPLNVQVDAQTSNAIALGSGV